MLHRVTRFISWLLGTHKLPKHALRCTCCGCPYWPLRGARMCTDCEAERYYQGSRPRGHG
jgi:hypothetical protein